jgi:RNA-directed DNA polymerase
VNLLAKQTALFNELFTDKALTDVFYEYIQTHSAVGVDGVSFDVFIKDLTNNINTITRKINDGSYRFSKYRTKLISKGPKKYPRELSMPTLRDKIVIKQLHTFIISAYGDSINFPRLHVIVGELFKEIKDNKYDYFIKTDIKDYYPSINHQLLIKQLCKKIKDIRALDLILKTLKRNSNSSNSMIGVPQGLAISNILANIYMQGFDHYFVKFPGIKMFRYVDDILILCKSYNQLSIESLLKKRLKKIKLSPHEFEKNGKSIHGLIAQNEFSYLGYTFSGDSISVRKKSISKILDSIIKVFTQHKNLKDKEKSHKYLEWKINLRITGAISEKKRYGWLFYFSQINDLKLLFSLDHALECIRKRFEADKFKCKSFVRAFHEITKNLNKTNYIVNYDNFDEDKKRELLKTVFLIKNIDTISSPDISVLFKRKIHKSLHELELDLQQQS